MSGIYIFFMRNSAALRVISNTDTGDPGFKGPTHKEVISSSFYACAKQTFTSVFTNECSDACFRIVKLFSLLFQYLYSKQNLFRRNRRTPKRYISADSGHPPSFLPSFQTIVIASRKSFPFNDLICFPPFITFYSLRLCCCDWNINSPSTKMLNSRSLSWSN